MSERMIDLGNGFWNIRGTLRIGGVVNVGTHSSLVRLSSGGFVFLDSYGFADYSDQGRARIDARAGGMLRLGADAQGRLTGADLAVPGADHLAHLLVAAVMNGSTASDLLDLPFYHPTLEEGMKPALRAISGSACSAKRSPLGR